ncbi:MAG: HAD hydrolase-like protein [Clostridia bacterium]|nr:HAD hydrolase-like protein [Clostridia bacterium]
MFKYILFDLDGTLTDPKEGITGCVRYALPFFGIQPPQPDDLLDFIGPPLVDSFMRRFDMTKTDAELATAKYRERFSTIGMFENRVYDGVPEMLESLKNAGCILAVASLKPLVFVEKILEKFELKKYFSAICGSDLEGTKHTKEQIIRDVFDILSPSDLSEVVMVGDRYQDVEGAKEVGIASIGVTYGYASPGELERYRADYIADTPQEITDIISNRAV